MANGIFDVERFRSFIKNWWVSLLLGLIFLIMGIVILIKPGESYMAMSMTFGIIVIVSGIMGIYLGISTPAHHGKGWVIASGVIELLLGIMLMAMPLALLTVLPYVLGFWLMFRGFTTIGIASDMMGYGVKGAGWTLFLAILLVICSFFVLANPVVGAGALVMWLAASFLLLGIALIAFAFKLNSLRKHIKQGTGCPV